MKHLFIVNPKAGKGFDAEEFCKRTEEKLKSLGVENYELHITTAAGEGCAYAKKAVEAGEPIRVYACGGDGTLYEVANACAEHKNAEVAAIPLGSGNDFIRIFGKKEELLDIADHINGTPVELDVIKCGDEYAINQCSMGIDAEICAKQCRFKKLPFLTGEASYTAALLYCFIGKMKSHFTVTIDDNETVESDFLFCVAANSRWYGGGYKAAPKALAYDGLLDFIVVRKDVPRIALLSFINKYKRGEHLDWDRTMFRRGKKINIKSPKVAAVNVDGECHYTNESTFEIVEKGIRFVVPKCSNYLERVEKGEL